MSASGSAERLLQIFEVFREARRPLSLTQLATRAAIPKSSCHGLVNSLLRHGFLYTLGRQRLLYPTGKLLDVAGEIRAGDPVLEDTLDLLEQLRDATRETVILGKREGSAVIYLAVLESPQAIRYSARAGEFKPLHSSAIGKALVGSLRDGPAQELLAAAGLPRVTPATITEAPRLAEDLAQSRRRGYYLTRGENVPDVWAVAAFLKLQQETFGVAVAGPRHRMEQTLESCALQLVATCSELARLGR